METLFIGLDFLVFFFFGIIWNSNTLLNTTIKIIMWVFAFGHILMFLQKTGIVSGINLI